VVTTSSNTYWAPLKPRVRVYALTDTTYASPIFSYDGFTGLTGDDDKVLALNFETNVSNVGQATITIEDSNHDLDIDTFVKGNRIFIEGSKDNSTWQPAFKGVVRSAAQEGIGETGRNLTITAYNYLIRLGERIVKVNKESSKTGSVYNQTDSTMFTDNLINDILTNNANYVYNTNEISGSILKSTNITSSPVTTWVPKLDVEFNTLQSAIDEVLDYSGGILAVDFADDQLELYDPDQITSSTGVFRVTNVVNKNADDVLNTMYPLEPYTYSIGYDTDESGSRLILPFKHPDTAPKGTHKENSDDQINATASTSNKYLYDFGKLTQAVSFTIRPSGDPGLIRAVFKTFGNCSSFANNSTRCWIYNDTVAPAASKPTFAISGPMVLYPRAADGSFPTSGTSYPASPTSILVLGMRDGDFCGELLGDKLYWLVFENTAAQSNTNRLGHVLETNGSTSHSYSLDNGATWSTPGLAVPIRMWNVPFKDQATPEINLDWIVTANDRNAQKRLGYVERTVTSIPEHIDGLQTIQHYLYPRINIASKPRFNFDYPSLTMPNKIPKAGDILCHMDTTIDVGTSTSAVQTSVITSARFDFGQDSDGVMGLRKLGLSTAGLRRGHY
jgi:hypothetical protein